jgi:hypothetical protein
LFLEDLLEIFCPNSTRNYVRSSFSLESAG